MFQHDTCYRLRLVRDAVRLGYSVDDGLSKAFGVFRYQRCGAQWDAVQLWLAPVLALPQDEAHAGPVLDAVEAVYRDACRTSAV